MKYVKQFCDQLQKEKILFAYKGVLSAQICPSVLSVIERKMEDLKDKVLVKRRMYRLMGMCLDELLERQSLNASQNAAVSNYLFSIGVDEEAYKIYVGYLVPAEYRNILTKKINYLNTLKSGDIGALYNNAIMEESGQGREPLTDFLYLRKKSGNAISFEFEEFDEQYVYFLYAITVERGETLEKQVLPKEIIFEEQHIIPQSNEPSILYLEQLQAIEQENSSQDNDSSLNFQEKNHEIIVQLDREQLRESQSKLINK